MVEGIVISHSISELDIDGGISCLHQFKVDDEASCSAIAVDEGMDGLKRDMQIGEFFHDIALVGCVLLHKVIHFWLDQIGLDRFLLCAHDANRHSAVYATIKRFIRKNEGVNLLDDRFRKGSVILDKVADEIERIFMTDRFHVVLQRFLIDGQALQNHIGFTQS